MVKVIEDLQINEGDIEFYLDDDLVFKGSEKHILEETDEYFQFNTIKAHPNTVKKYKEAIS